MDKKRASGYLSVRIGRDTKRRAHEAARKRATRLGLPGITLSDFTRQFLTQLISEENAADAAEKAERTAVAS